MEILTKLNFIGLHRTGVKLRVRFYKCFNFPSVFIQNDENHLYRLPHYVEYIFFHRQDEKWTTQKYYCKNSSICCKKYLLQKYLYIIIRLFNAIEITVPFMCCSRTMRCAFSKIHRNSFNFEMNSHKAGKSNIRKK